MMLSLCAALALGAGLEPAKFTVAGGDSDAANVLVSVGELLTTRDDLRSVTVRTPDGTALPAQLVKTVAARPADGFRYDVVVLVPKLAAGASLPLSAAFSTDAPSAGGFAWGEPDGKQVDLTLGGKTVLRYVYAPYERPDDLKKCALTNPTLKVWHHVFDPETGARLTNGPEGQYPHHRGLYFGFNKVSYGDKKAADVWHGRNGESQRHEEFLGSVAGPLFGRQTVKVAWCGTDGKPFAHETREVTAYALPGGTLIDFVSELTTELPKVRLDGDPQHAGFHFRANAAVEKAKAETYFVRPDGKGGPGQERNWEPKSGKGPVNLPWDAMSFVLDGKRYTALRVNHPANPKDARGSERAYGRLGDYFEYDLTPETPLRVRYRVWVQPGEMTPEQCEAVSRAFVAPPAVKVVAK